MTPSRRTDQIAGVVGVVLTLLELCLSNWLPAPNLAGAPIHEQSPVALAIAAVQIVVFVGIFFSSRLALWVCGLCCTPAFCCCLTSTFLSAGRGASAAYPRDAQIAFLLYILATLIYANYCFARLRNLWKNDSPGPASG